MNDKKKIEGSTMIGVFLKSPELAWLEDKVQHGYKKSSLIRRLILEEMAKEGKHDTTS